MFAEQIDEQSHEEDELSVQVKHSVKGLGSFQYSFQTIWDKKEIWLDNSVLTASAWSSDIDMVSWSLFL